MLIKSSSLPFSLKLSILLLSMLDSIVINLVYPILPFMVQHYLSKSASENSISQYSGYLEGTYRLAQFFGCIFVSLASDRINKKNILIFTTSFHVLASFSLAFCNTYTQAFINRAIAGLCTSDQPIIKSLIQEVTTDENVSELYGAFALGIALSNIIGPLFAMTSNPGKSLPSIFKNFQFFDAYPYSPPLLLHILAFATLIIVISYLHSPAVTLKKIPISSLLSNKPYLATIFIYLLLGFTQSAFRLFFSLICKSSEDLGGMGIGYEYQISLIQLSAGLVMILLISHLTSYLNVKIGLRVSLFYLCIGIGISCVLVGICGFFDGILKFCALVAVYLECSVCLTVGFCYVSICSSNAVERSVLGSANGFSHAIVGVARFASTSGTGVVYGWSVSDGMRFGIDAKFTCFVAGCFQ